MDKPLNDNRVIAEKRLYYLTKVVQPTQIQPERVYYMPHKPVYREDKTTSKLRIVFDASSSDNESTSLNEHLSSVDNLVANLFKVLLQFRSNKIAINADIEKAFLQISMSENDRDSRWNKPLPRIEEFRMTRVTFGATSSPFLLTATINHHLDKYKHLGPICEKLKYSFYVDDLILSVNDVNETEYIYHTAKKIMSTANFNLRKWTTNHQRLQETISTEKEVSTEQKVLGICWNKMFDIMSVDIANNLVFLENLKPTKRNVLKAMAKIYDPLGFVSPFTVRIKILLQEIWENNSEWDQQLSGNLADKFESWKSELNLLKVFSFQSVFHMATN
ncbi:uncharacterized protein LOC142224837 [Haematobia irritans]|uniref:uncharacterized protein LOC142224837 n=1 Tax=Haematobia irritans TaxID=7368 RepID=UPI003F504517